MVDNIAPIHEFGPNEILQNNTFGILFIHTLVFDPLGFVLSTFFSTIKRARNVFRLFGFHLIT